MPTRSGKSPTQEDLPKEEEETKQQPQNPQEQSKEEAEEEAKMASLQKAINVLMFEYGLIPASDEVKKGTSQETNIHSTTRTPSSSSSSSSSCTSTPPDSIMPPKPPFDHPGKDDNESREKEKNMEEDAHGGDPNDKKPKEEYSVRLSTDIGTEIALLRNILEFHSVFKEYPFDDSSFFQFFMTSWLNLDVMLEKEMNTLKEKYEKAEAQIGKNLNDLGPFDRRAFVLAQRIWSTQSETEIVFDVDGDEENPIKDPKESISNVEEAEIVILQVMLDYHMEKGICPSRDVNILTGFIKTWVKYSLPPLIMTQIIHNLRANYEKRLGKILENVGISDSRNQEAFKLAKKIWGTKKSKRE